MQLDKLKISLLLTVPIISAAATGGGIWASTSARISAAETAHVELKARVEKVEPDVQSLKTDVAVLKANSEATLRSLERVEDKLGTK
jgi:hypothetical protein